MVVKLYLVSRKAFSIGLDLRARAGTRLLRNDQEATNLVHSLTANDPFEGKRDSTLSIPSREASVTVDVWHWRRWERRRCGAGLKLGSKATIHLSTTDLIPQLQKRI
jgi:hypothetical protein